MRAPAITSATSPSPWTPAPSTPASAPQALATLRNLANGVLHTLRADNIAKTNRAIRDLPERALPFFGISDEPDPSGT
ncbi:hypothetical protein GCM10009603_16100 [Nocardiopsis exhalans]